MTKVDILTEIDKKDLHLLWRLYKLDGVESYTRRTYITIDTYIRWFNQNPDLENIHFYCINGNFSNGTFVVTVSD